MITHCKQVPIILIKQCHGKYFVHALSCFPLIKASVLVLFFCFSSFKKLLSNSNENLLEWGTTSVLMHQDYNYVF